MAFKHINATTFTTPTAIFTAPTGIPRQTPITFITVTLRQSLLVTKLLLLQAQLLVEHLLRLTHKRFTLMVEMLYMRFLRQVLRQVRLLLLTQDKEN
jgi:hypothetical protein